ncbi:MAG: cation transporter [Desulfomonilaceae bacterium]|nr:cation transporter [Desulfomonilaceae bacterium]
MSEKRRMKEITMDTLEQSEHKVSLGRLKKGIGALFMLLVLAGGVYGAYRLVAGDVVASRFVVDKMNCPACVVTVQEVTGKLPGVIRADVSLAGKDVVVQFRERQTSADEIQSVIANAGYPARLEGLFSPDGGGIDETVVAVVNGKPIFQKELKVPFNTADKEVKAQEPAAALFTVVGKAIVLQAADKETVVVQPFEVDEEVERIFKNRGGTREEFRAWITANYGSPEKFNQIVGQRLGIRRLLEDHILDGVTDAETKKHKAMEWIGTLFRDSKVLIVDEQLKETLQASVGQKEWSTFWPRMIGSETELKKLLTQ